MNIMLPDVIHNGIGILSRTLQMPFGKHLHPETVFFLQRKKILMKSTGQHMSAIPVL